MACSKHKDRALEVAAPACLTRPMFVREKRLLGAGPSNPPNAVLNALSQPMMGHLHPETLQVNNKKLS